MKATLTQFREQMKTKAGVELVDAGTDVLFAPAEYIVYKDGRKVTIIELNVDQEDGENYYTVETEDREGDADTLTDSDIVDWGLAKISVII